MCPGHPITMPMDQPQTCHIVTGRQLARRNIEACIASRSMPVRLVDCDLDGADLSRLDLSGFMFERCALIEADLSNASAVGTIWTSCRARKTILRGIDLTDAVFRSGDWNNGDWQASRIAGAAFTGVKLTGSGFKEAKTLGATFQDCLMQSCGLLGLSFRKAKLGRCDMSRADLRECDFRDAMFDAGSSIAGSAIAGARFDGADLREVDLSGHGIDSIKTLTGARISAAQAAGMVAGAGLRVG